MILRFINALGEVVDFFHTDIVLQGISGLGASGVDTTLIERAFREGAAYIRRRSQPRMITISFDLVGPQQATGSTRADLLRRLSPALGQGTLEYRPGATGDVFSIDGSVIQLQVPASNPGFLERSAVQIECPFPFWRGQTLNTQTIEVAGSLASETVTNTSNLPIFPTVTVEEAAGGTVVDASWNNTTTGENMTTTADAGSGQRIEADHFTSDITRQPAGVNLIDEVAITSRFWALQPGANTVQCSRSGTLGDVHFIFSWHDLLSGV